MQDDRILNFLFKIFLNSILFAITTSALDRKNLYNFFFIILFDHPVGELFERTITFIPKILHKKMQ